MRPSGRRGPRSMRRRTSCWPIGTRAQTRSDHLQLVLTHLKWRRVDDSDREKLARWLVQRAVEHDAPATLVVFVAEHLRARRALGASWSGSSRSTWRCALARAVAIMRASASTDGRSNSPPARRRALEALGRRMTAQQLRRLEPARRYPLMLVLLAAAIKPGELPIDEQQLEQLRGSYSHLRPALHAVLDAVALRGATSSDDELLATLKRVARRASVSSTNPSGCSRRRGAPGCSTTTAACNAHATSSDCGSSLAMPCAPDACIARSGAATPTPQGSSCPPGAGMPIATSSRSRSAARSTSHPSAAREHPGDSAALVELERGRATTAAVVRAVLLRSGSAARPSRDTHATGRGQCTLYRALCGAT